MRTGTLIWLAAANDADLEIGENNQRGVIAFNAYWPEIGADLILLILSDIQTSDHGFKKGELDTERRDFRVPH